LSGTRLLIPSAEGKKKPLSRNKKQRWEYEKLYDKDKINRLYLRYSRHKDGRVLKGLIAMCDPLLDCLLAQRYSRHFRHHEDFKQEIQLRLWVNLRKRSRERLQRECYVVNPTAYLYFLCRAYAWKIFLKKFRKIEENEAPF